MKISEAFEQKPREQRDARTGEVIPACVGRTHKWVYINAMWMKCDRVGCTAVKSRE